MIITGCYIFYVHNTFLDYHIDMALDSINKQNAFDPIDKFVLYNNTYENKFGFPIFDNDKLLNKIKTVLGNKFKNYTYIKNIPETSEIIVDLECQRQNIIGYDYYFTHKSDFYLPKHIVCNIQRYMESDNSNPMYCNFAKFDTREFIEDQRIRELAEFENFNKVILEDDVAYTEGYKWPIGLSINHKAVGYRGLGNYFDGTIHLYNESARKNLIYKSFWTQEVIDENRNNGINMWISKDMFFAYHMFHDIKSNKPIQKTILGHRF